MSKDIFINPASSPSNRLNYGFAGRSISRAQDGISSNLVPRDPEMQRLVDAINAEWDAERARKAVELNTPENRQKAVEAEIAERERKRIDFHFCRATPRFLEEGWKHIGGDFVDDEIRVYTDDYERRRFWGIKPAGMGMFDFWEKIDPEISRYDDNIEVTWANPLIPPPVTAHDENNPVIWAGPGLNPDLPPQEQPLTEAPPIEKAGTKRRMRPKTPDINPTHRVRKPTTQSPKIKRNTRRSLAEKDDARDTRRGINLREATATACASGRELRKKTAGKPSSTQQKGAIEDEDPAPPKRPRGRPAIKTHPPAKMDSTSQPKRPRGRPPTKGKPSQQKTTSAVKGNARVGKSARMERRPVASSTHKMRTRKEGPAELVQLS